jgi:acetyl esterase
MQTLLPEIAELLARGALPSLQALQGAAPVMASVRDVQLPGHEGVPLGARVYVPQHLPEGAGLVVFFHGGGWSRGDLDLYDQPCRALADAAGCTVASVAYRLAPQHRFPVPLLDCFAATTWFAARQPAGAPLAVAGDSAGGALAAAVCLMAREAGPSIAHQLLIYPPLDARMHSPSYREHAHAAFLDSATMRAHYAAYAGDADPEDPLLSPLRAPDLQGLPPATLLSAQFDPVRDDAHQYAQRLTHAGVPTRLIALEGAPHMALHLGGVSDACARIPILAGQALREHLMPASPTPLPKEGI